MTKAIITDLNRCVGCLACSVACKAVNNVPIGSYWNKVVRVGPNPIPGGSGQYPDVYMYFLPISCQHCENPECVKVCPTEASHVAEDGSIQIDKEKCIGCQYCIYACPYGVRQFNEDAGVVQKCTLCAQITADGDGVPACVHNCNCGARFFGDYDDPESDVCRELAKYPEEAIHTLPDPNDAKPLTRYILSPKFASWKELV
ncbi:4Fe-4S dicluster domain-containing protein [Adlercreutzia sp.]|uniref:4Fe-4S dicluster domain-containing protein n=1 Tax=Adlercreutzia sp. TaxID=1872387 RepID=UPI003AF020D3